MNGGRATTASQQLAEPVHTRTAWLTIWRKTLLTLLVLVLLVLLENSRKPAGKHAWS